MLRRLTARAAHSGQRDGLNFRRGEGFLAAEGFLRNGFTGLLGSEHGNDGIFRRQILARDAIDVVDGDFLHGRNIVVGRIPVLDGQCVGPFEGQAFDGITAKLSIGEFVAFLGLDQVCREAVLDVVSQDLAHLIYERISVPAFRVACHGEGQTGLGQTRQRTELRENGLAFGNQCVQSAALAA